jgi:Protein of unknown function (DUF3995)
MLQTFPAIILVLIAILHSALGERLLIGPLLQHTDWPALSMGRFLGRRTLRFAWHLTSLTWVGMAAMLWTNGAHHLLIAAVLLGVSGLMTFACSRGRHFAWALFLAGSLGALSSAHLLSPSVGVAMGGIAAVVLLCIALLHLGWALGLRWGITQVLPRVEGKPAFTPGPLLTIAVAMALLVAALLALGLAGFMAPLPYARTLGFMAAVIFAMRVVGDGKYAGLLKRVRGSSFATYDDLLFIPLCFGLSVCFLFASNLEAL